MAKKPLTLEQRLTRAQAVIPDIRTRLKARIGRFIDDELALADAKRSRGRAKGGGQSSKAKGRSAVLLVKDILHSAYPSLENGDILVKATSQIGCDIHLSPSAKKLFPFGIEVKCAEAFNIWSALRQAELNAKADGVPSVVFFKRASTEMFMALRAQDFFQFVKRTDG